MSNLSIRKKSINTWLHTDSVFGDFIISKFYFNSFFAKFQIVEEGNARLEQYEIANITLYDDTDGGVAETFTTITELSLRLEELQYPAFDRTGTSVFPSMEQITNVNVTDIEDGQVLAWDVATSKWVNITIGGSTTPNFQEVTDVAPVGETTNPIKVPEVQYYDAPYLAYGKIKLEDAQYSFYDANDVLLFTIDLENGRLISYNNTNSFFNRNEFSIPTANRVRVYPDEDGDIATINIVNANKTAVNSIFYIVIANTTFTDPTPVEGKGYIVFVRNGTATIGGVGYTAGSLVYRFYYSGAWSSTSIGGSTTPTLQQVTDGAGNNETTNPLVVTDGFGNATEQSPDFIGIVSPTSVKLDYVDRTENVDKSTSDFFIVYPPDTYTNTNFRHPVKDAGDYFYDTQSEIINANTTAQNDSKYTVIANATFTDPTGVEGKGYTVFVRNGTATIGGVGYTAGSLVYRFYYSGAWSSTSIGGTVPDADASTKGIAKLYTDLLNSYTDGSVTQAAIVSGLALKQDKPQILNLTSDYTLTSSTSAQKLFNVGTGGNGAFDATASTIYEFELFVDLSTLSSTSGFFSFSLTGTATYNNLRLKSTATKTALITGSAFEGVITSASAYQLTTANTATVGTIVIKGLINVNGAGTIIPSITLSQASAGVVLTNSYCKLTKI